jgi:hypothetical protein
LPRARGADTDPVRQISPVTNLILAVGAGVAMLASLSLSWFAAPTKSPTATDGPVESAAYQVQQFFSADVKGEITGTVALGDTRTVLVALVAIVALAALAVSMPAMRRPAESFMQLLALAVPLVVIGVTIAHPGTGPAPVRVHSGALVGVGLALLMASAAWHGATLREKRKAPKGVVRISQS